jgi:hypothetical protein
MRRAKAARWSLVQPVGNQARDVPRSKGAGLIPETKRDHSVGIPMESGQHLEAHRNSRHRRRCLMIWSGSLPLREKLVANETRGWGQTNASRLTPCRLVDLFLITDDETTGRFIRDEYSVAHFPARSPVPGLDLFPEPQPS